MKRNKSLFKAAAKIAAGIFSNSKLVESIAEECSDDPDHITATISVMAVRQAKSLDNFINKDDKERKIVGKN